MFKKVSGASTHEFNRGAEFCIASNDHDGKRKLASVDLYDQRANSHARKITGREDASGRHRGDLNEKLFRAIVNFYGDGFACQRDHDVIALWRRRNNDINQFAHEPSWGPANDRYSGETTTAT
jgi:hypothetical protein